MKKMHHANIVTGSGNQKDFVFNLLAENLKFDVKANPDFLLLENRLFGIDDVRNFEEWVINKPFTGETKVALIIAKSISREAQGALLKTLEEPPPGTYIFISLENLGGVLPTLLSRARVLNVVKKDGSKNDALKFIRSGIKERLSMVRSLSERKDKNLMKDLIKDLEEISYQNYPKAAKNILKAKILSSANGSSPRMLLEWLSSVI